MVIRYASVGASVGMLTAFLMMAAVGGCFRGHLSLPGNNCPGMDSYGFTLGGTVSGLVGSGLTLQNEPNQSPPYMNVASNGPQLLGSVDCYTAYDVAIHTQPVEPSQTCVVANGSGPGGTAGVDNIAITCTTNPPRFAYVANSGSGNISGFTVDSTTGALAAIAGSPFSAGGDPVAIAVDPTGSYAYVANQADATVSAFLIDRSTGALMSVAGSPYVTGAGPTSVAIDSTSSFVYITNSGAGTVSVYSISPASGGLTPAAGSPFAVGGSPSSVIVAPGNNYTVFVADRSASTVSIYAPPFNGSLALAPGSPIATGMGASSLALDAFSDLYVANAISNTLSGFTQIDTSVPTPAAGSPYSTGTTPASVVLTPLDNFVYVANKGSNDISEFSLDAATGALTPLAGSPIVATGTQPASVVIDPTGAFAYVANSGSNTVSVYAIDSTTGVLTATGGSFATGSAPSALAICD